ncbi:tripartite tricarboxylate transporter permease [Nocardiopsis nanhaiensis]
MEHLDSVLQGFQVALQPTNLLFVALGVLVGTLIGVLPGLGPTATIALLLPLTYVLEPATAIILLAGIYYGSVYGGTITSVLLRIPGEASSVVTTFDGYPMAQQGRAGPALGIAALGSFAGGMTATVFLVILAPLLAGVALSFGPPEYTLIALAGVLLVAYMGNVSIGRALVAAGLGLFLTAVGLDPISGEPRFTFDTTSLLAGLDFIPIAMGLFGLGEVLYNIDKSPTGTRIKHKIGRIIPSRSDFGLARGALARGTVLGSLLGLLPGGGSVVSSMASYVLEKRRAKDPSRFGKGAVEGVAGPEAASNAGSTTAFVPLLTLGIPPNVVLALLYGALLIQGITPGPTLMTNQPDVFWGVIASMFVGNVLLLLFNTALIGAFVQVLRIPITILSTVAVVVMLIGVYTVQNRVFDMVVVLVFGLVGYAMRKFGYEVGPLVLAFILGGILEVSLRQSLLISGGDFSVFVTRPVSSGIIAVIAVLMLVAVGRRWAQRRTVAPESSTDRS